VSNDFMKDVYSLEVLKFVTY